MAKIKNLYVVLKIGNREYKFKNLILDKMLCSYANSLDPNLKIEFVQTALERCVISFNPITDIMYDRIFQENEFDIMLSLTRQNTIINSNKINATSVFASEGGYITDISTGKVSKLLNYAEKKICVLGFRNSSTELNDYISAVLDVSNYDIYIQEGEEITITRVDVISTDAIFTNISNQDVYENLKGPVHLCPNRSCEGLLPETILTSSDGKTQQKIKRDAEARLISYGLSNTPNNIDLEYDIEGNYEIKGNVFSIKNIWSPKGLYLSKDLYPMEDLYPDIESFKYLVLKFKLFQKVAEGAYGDFTEVDTYTGAQYLQAITLVKRGSVDLNIKYERG